MADFASLSRGRFFLLRPEVERGRNRSSSRLILLDLAVFTRSGEKMPGIAEPAPVRIRERRPSGGNRAMDANRNVAGTQNEESPRLRSTTSVTSQGEEKSGGNLPSPTSATPAPLLVKQSSVRANCLCSPTTHAGSFRCRHHRSSGLSRAGYSVGSGLSELEKKFSSAERGATQV